MNLPLLKAPNLSDQDIRKKADAFLQKYNHKQIVPTPIEDIVDIELEIFIISLPELQQILPIDGFITNDFKSIYVDKGLYDRNNSRYLFTLSHELGHMFLHQRLYKSLTIDQCKVIQIILMI